MKKTEQHIRNLIEKPIELDELEVEINKLKPKMNTIDEELINQVQTKYTDGREFQSNCVTIIQSASENEFTQDGIKVIENLMKDAKKLNLDFPELRRLETVKLIPKWVARLHAIIVEGSADKGGSTSASKKDAKLKKVKPLRTLRQEAMKGLDTIEPSKMSSAMKEELIASLSNEVPEVLDQELNKLLRKIQLILWIKDAHDLIGKETIVIADLVALKDTPAQDDNLFQHLKFKYLTYHKQITDLIEAQETWMSKANQLENKISAGSDGYVLDKTKQDQLRKGLDMLKKGMGSNLDKIAEVREKFQGIQQRLSRAEWFKECNEYLKDETSKRTLEGLEQLYRKAEDCKVGEDQPLFLALETLFTAVKEISLKTKKLTVVTDKMDTEDNEQFTIMDYEKKAESLKEKISNEELDQLLKRMKDLQNKIDFTKEIAQLDTSKKNQDKYIQSITRCYNAHWSALENYQDTPIQELLTIRKSIQDIANLEGAILVSLPKFDAYYLKLHWSVDCAFFLTSSPAIKMNKDLEACGNLVKASKVIKEIETSKLCGCLNEQLNLYNKCNDAVDILRRDEKKKKFEDRSRVMTSGNLTELETALRGVTIEESQSLSKYVSKVKSKVASAIREHKNTVSGDDKHPLSFWKSQLDILQKLPIRTPEEVLLEATIQHANELETEIKSFKKTSGNGLLTELVERYKMQRVKLTDGEKLISKAKLKEDALSGIEHKLYGTSEPLSYSEALKITQELQQLQGEFKGERIDRIRQELLLKKILVIKELWENKGKTEGSSLQQMRELQTQAKQKFAGRTEVRFIDALKFLDLAVSKCEAKAKEIGEITNIKQLESMLKDDSNNDSEGRFCGFVDMNYEIVERLAELKIIAEQLAKKNAEKKLIAKQQLAEKQSQQQQSQLAQYALSTNDSKSVKKENLTKDNQKITKQAFKSCLVSDVAKAINITYNTLTLQECLQHGQAIVDRAFIEIPSKTEVKEQVAAMCKVIGDLKKHPLLSQSLRKKKFDYQELIRLSQLAAAGARTGKNALEKEDRILMIARENQLDNDDNYLLDMKLKKKPDATATQSEEIIPVTIPAIAELPVKKVKPNDAYAIPQFDVLFKNLLDPKPYDSSYVNVDENNVVKQSVAKIREGKLSLAKQLGNLPSNRQSVKKYGSKFSDDEEDDDNQASANEYIPLREEDFEGLNDALSIMTQSSKAAGTASVVPSNRKKNQGLLQFDPDAQSVSAAQDEAPESTSVLSLLKGSMEILIGEGQDQQPQLLEKIYVLSAEDVKECMLMPQCPTESGCMGVKGVLGLSNFVSYHANLIQEKELNPERKIRVLGGWMESESIACRDLLENYARQLKIRERVAVVEWTPECKLYVMHRDTWNTCGNENHQIKFRRNFFHVSKNPDDTLLFLMIFKQYKLEDPNHYENLRPIFIQKRATLSSANPLLSTNTVAAEKASVTQDKKLQSLINAYSNTADPSGKLTASMKQNLLSGLGSKRSQGKMSALEVLALESEDDEPMINDEDEERRINDRINALKNQFQRIENKHKTNYSYQHPRQTQSQTTNNNYFQRKFNNSQHNSSSVVTGNFVDQNNRFNTGNSQSFNSNSQNINPNIQSQNPRSNTQRSYTPRSVNRSGVSTPNYYEQQQANEQQSFNRAPYARKQQQQLNESMEIEEQYANMSNTQTQPFYRQSVGKSLKRPYNNSMKQQQQQQIQHEKIQTQNVRQPAQDPSQINTILNSLDQTLKELIKSQKTQNDVKQSGFLINSLLQQQQQQQILQQLSQVGQINNASDLADKKKKLRRRKKRSVAPGLNLSLDASSMSEEGDSQESFPRQSFQSQQQTQSFQQNFQQQQQYSNRNNNNNNNNSNNNNNNNNNIQVQNRFQYTNSKSQNQNQQQQSQQFARPQTHTPYLNALNNKKQVKIFGKQQYQQQQQQSQQQQQQNQQIQQRVSVPNQMENSLNNSSSNNNLNNNNSSNNNLQIPVGAPLLNVNSQNQQLGKPTIQFTVNQQLPLPNSNNNSNNNNNTNNLGSSNSNTNQASLNSLTALNQLHQLQKLNPKSSPSRAIPQINPSKETNPNNRYGASRTHGHHPNQRHHHNNSNNAFRNLQKQANMDSEINSRPLLTDLSKSGRVNQEKNNNNISNSNIHSNNAFLSSRGETKEAASNSSDIPRYMKEKSVRNPTFYPSKLEPAQPQQPESSSSTMKAVPQSQDLKKSGFSYSSINSREGSLEKQRVPPAEKENNAR